MGLDKIKLFSQNSPEWGYFGGVFVFLCSDFGLD